MPRRIVFAAFLLLGLCTPVLADTFESDILFSKGHWQVKLTYNETNGSFWCSAETRNRNGQQLSITGFEDSQLALFFFDDRWSLSPRSIRFLVDIDYFRWAVEGNARNISVSFTFNDIEKTKKFLGQLRNGNAVALFTESAKRIAVFSLNGSSASLDAFFECWSRIDKSDPFATSSDPF